MQQVGTKIVVKDTGVLSVTSTRLVFSGRTTTQESVYDKIENLTVFNDGLAVAVRQRGDIVTRSYSTSAGEMLAAIINAAMQPKEPVQHLGTSSTDAAVQQETPVSNVGLMSADGAWRWDGTAWQPVERTPASS